MMTANGGVVGAAMAMAILFYATLVNAESLSGSQHNWLFDVYDALGA
jgi:hypothetical protein